MSSTQPLWDVFLSYASEDRDNVARPLANHLIRQGLVVWFDEMELKVGDSLRERIDHGLAQSRFAAVVLSKSFFRKHWTTRELSGLVQREAAGEKVILPIWYDVDECAVRQFSPPLADRIGVPWALGQDAVAARLMAVIRPDVSPKTAAVPESETGLESPILHALERAAYGLLDDDILSGLIAETNASNYVPDDFEVLSMGPLDFATVTASFEASIHFTGEPEPDHMYCGHALLCRVRGTIRFDGSDWDVEDYDVVSAEIEGMDYEPDDD